MKSGGQIQGKSYCASRVFVIQNQFLLVGEAPPIPLNISCGDGCAFPSNTKKEWYQLPGITPISSLNSAADSVLFRCFQPLCGCFFARNFYCQMREPAVLCCAMPMLHTGRNVYAVTRLHRNRFLAPFLIPPSAPPTQIRIWPPPLLAWWICQLFWQPGSKVTLWIPICEAETGARKLLPEK